MDGPTVTPKMLEIPIQTCPIDYNLKGTNKPVRYIIQFIQLFHHVDFEPPLPPPKKNKNGVDF